MISEMIEGTMIVVLNDDFLTSAGRSSVLQMEPWGQWVSSFIRKSGPLKQMVEDTSWDMHHRDLTSAGFLPLRYIICNVLNF